MRYAHDVSLSPKVGRAGVEKRFEITLIWISNAQIYLEIIDEYYDQSLWTFPEVSALRDLWTSVKYQASGVKDLLDDLLQDEESS